MKDNSNYEMPKRLDHTKYEIIWIRHSLQASIASTHRHVHKGNNKITELRTCTNSSFGFRLFFIILEYFSLFFNSTYPVNSIAKEIIWVEIYRGRLFLGPRYMGDDFFLGPTVL